MEIISGDEPKEPQSNQNNSEASPWGMDVKQFNMLMHIAQFAGYIIPLGGFILPIVMWSSNKELDKSIDANGKNIINWMISSVIYAIVFILLIFMIIGIPLLVALGICSTIFTIIGAIKASNGEIYRYPFSFTFLK
jgi:uncharacterized Tic20 family protein